MSITFSYQKNPIHHFDTEHATPQEKIPWRPCPMPDEYTLELHGREPITVPLYETKNKDGKLLYCGRYTFPDTHETFTVKVTPHHHLWAATITRKTVNRFYRPREKSKQENKNEMRLLADLIHGEPA